MRNPTAPEKGLWRIDRVKIGLVNGHFWAVGTESEQQVIYDAKTLSIKEQIAAANHLRKERADKAKAIVVAAEAAKDKPTVVPIRKKPKLSRG